MNLYDKIGAEYSQSRKADPRIKSIIHGELRGAKTIINIGAGTGSYEPEDANVLAIEPSNLMISQRPKHAAVAIQASAESLAYPNNAFDLAMALLSIHHWSDVNQGLKEMKRVSKRQIIFTWDPEHAGFWLTQDYFPEILNIDKKIFPRLDHIQAVLGPLKLTSIPIPHDCTDCFGSAFWRRPKAYLSPSIRSAMSTFQKISTVEKGVKKLKHDIESGLWNKRYGHLLQRESLDLGFVLLSSK